MDRARVRVTAEQLGEVSPFIFGALTEHFGYGLYGGIWDKERDIPRADVQAATRSLGIKMFRYPGGCFSDWYHWRDGIGPKQRRPTYESTYWTDFRMEEQFGEELARQFGPVETNQFGTDEFLRYCLDTEIEPHLVANFGTGTHEEAADWVHYTNVSGEAPRKVKFWSVGNETYGPWELGHCPPEDYAGRFNQYAEAMKAVDPSIQIIAVGAGRKPEWNSVVARDAGEIMDGLSVHWYFPGPGLGRALRDDEADHLRAAAAPLQLGAMLDEAISDLDKAIPDKKIPLSFDEWNMWALWEDLLTTNHRLADSVFFAGCYNRMIERAERVKFAAISHLVNCMAPIQTRGDRHFGTSSFLTGMLYRRFVRDTAVVVEVECANLAIPEVRADEPVTLTESTRSGGKEAPLIDASATTDGAGVSLFLSSRSLASEVGVEVSGLGSGQGRFRFIAGPDPFAVNDVDRPNVLGFKEFEVEVKKGSCSFRLSPHTAGVLTVSK